MPSGHGRMPSGRGRIPAVRPRLFAICTALTAREWARFATMFGFILAVSVAGWAVFVLRAEAQSRGPCPSDDIGPLRGRASARGR
jgi:hypothetical protein